MLYYRKDLLQAIGRKIGMIITMIFLIWSKLGPWLLEFSQERHADNASQYGYMESLYDSYFSSGFLFSYGAYIFGDNNTDTNDIGLRLVMLKKELKLFNNWLLLWMRKVLTIRLPRLVRTVNSRWNLFCNYVNSWCLLNVFRWVNKNLWKRRKIWKEETKELASENLVMVSLPQLPESGDLTDDSSNWLTPKRWVVLMVTL